MPMQKKFLEYIMQFLSDNKHDLFRQNVNLRTRYATIVLEDLYQPHNASAVMRTCDCFGIQDVHIIEKRNKWITTPDIERGSSKWININRYNTPDQNNTLACLKSLKSKGYKCVATTPHTELTIDSLPLDAPVALIFGNEGRGVSQEVLDNVDYKIKIPMYGFTESFNISVAAAICMNTLRQRLNDSSVEWQLSEEEKIDTMIHWCSKTLDRYEKYEKVFLERFGDQ